MENILLITQNQALRDKIIDACSGFYQLLTESGWESGLALLQRIRNDLIAVLIDLELAYEKDPDFLKTLKTLRGEYPSPLLSVIGIASNLSGLSDFRCFENGAFELITLDTPSRLILRRIRSATSATATISFHELERLLKVLPSSIYLKDTQGRYVFATHYWDHMNDSDSSSWTVQGKTDLEIRKNTENAKKAIESDQQIFRTGKGMQYVIEEQHDGAPQYLELIKRPVFDHDGKITGIIALVNDVTEQQLLKMELEKRAQVDQLTELLNKVTTEEVIAMRLLSGKKYAQSGALMMVDVDNFKQINDHYGHVTGDRVLAEIGRVIRNGFRGADVAGRVGGDEFMIYVQNTDTAAAALQLANRISSQIVASVTECTVSVSIGVSLFPAHGQTFEELYRAADSALYQVKGNGKASCAVYQPK